MIHTCTGSLLFLCHHVLMMPVTVLQARQFGNATFFFLHILLILIPMKGREHILLREERRHILLWRGRRHILLLEGRGHTIPVEGRGYILLRVERGYILLREERGHIIFGERAYPFQGG